MSGSLVLVMRCVDAPVPGVPSRVVRCAGCGCECWLSKATGAQTVALAATLGEPSFTCLPCLEVSGRKTYIMPNPAAEREAREAR